LAARAVVAQAEDLFELVDDERQVGARSQGGAVQGARVLPQLVGAVQGHAQRGRTLLERVRARRDQENRLVPEPCHQAGPEQGRLARPGRAEHGQEPSGSRALDEFVGQPLAPEEPVGVLRLEGGEPGVRAVGVVVGFLARIGGERVPPLRPLVGVAPARPDVGERHGQGRQPLPGRRVGQRRRRIVGLPGELPIGR